MENVEPPQKLADIAVMIDELLSRQNVAVDAALFALMTKDPVTSQLCIKPGDLLKHPKLQHIKSVDSIIEAPVQTKKNEHNCFYPELKAPRRTLIFRDVCPAQESDILSLLSKCPKLQDSPTTPSTDSSSSQSTPATPLVLSLKFDSTAVANVCYVTLQTEELAKEVAIWLMTQELDGKPVKVGMKTEAEWSFTNPPPVINNRRNKQGQNNNANYNQKNKKRFNRKMTKPVSAAHVLSALDQFPPLETTNSMPPSQQLIRYSPKEMRAIRDAILNKQTEDQPTSASEAENSPLPLASPSS